MELCCTPALESHYSKQPYLNPPFKIPEAVVHPLSGKFDPCGEARSESTDRLLAARRTFSAVLCVVAIFAAGCGNHNLDSGYGIGWVTLTDEPGDFTSYIVNVDSITLTRSDGVPVTALATPETVDFTKLENISELWGSASIPTGTYLSASIMLDYTNANISVMVNGLPQKATVVNSAGTAVTTVTVNMILDPANPFNLVPTFATTAAQRLAVDFNLAASTLSINLATTPATVTVQPYLTAAVAAPDSKLIRVRGPLINSSVNLGTYTVYVRPFHDEINSLGSLTMFTDANTVYATNGMVSVGTPGINQLSQSSAGTTITAGYTTYEPTATPSATAAIFHAKYVVAGSTLQDVYTQGLEGDVVARNGNTLTVRGSTLFLNDGTATYNVADAVVVLGPSTIVTADGNSTLTGLNYKSVAVGQHIMARGIYSLPNNVVTVDATGASSTNTGSVRLISTSLWGSLVSSAAGSLVLNLQTINNWPVADFAFAGNGATAASDPSAANFLVNTAAIPLTDTTVGDSQFIDGLVAPFGTAPPDFNASAVNAEVTAPASMRIQWTSPGTMTPFTTLTPTAIIVNLGNPSLASAVIRIGSESISLASLPASPMIVPQVVAEPTPTATTPPPVFLPLFSFGNPQAVAPGGISQYSVASTYVAQLTSTLAASPALQFEARGTYDRVHNTFSASSINVVL